MAKMADAWNGTTLTVSKYGDEVDRSTKKTDRSRGSLRRFGSDAIKLNQALSLLGKTLRLAKIPAFAAAAGTAVQALSALTGGAVALTAALGPLTGLLAALPGLYSAVGQAVISVMAAFSPVTSVLKEMGTAHASAGTSATQNAKAQKSAAKAIASAEKQLTAANREQKEAVRGLTAARKEARKALQDLRVESEGAALSEKRAVLSLQEARKAYNRSAVEGATPSEVKSLALSVEEAELGLKESRISRKRTDEELGKQESKGVARSEQVTAAKQELRQAEEGVREAQAGVTEAMEQQKEAAEGSSAAASKLASRFAELSPQAQRFAKYIFGLKDKLRALQAAIGKQMFPGMESGLKSALKNFPVLERVMGKTGGAIGKLAKRTGALLGSKGFGGRFEKIGDNNAKTIGRLGGAAINLVDALSHVMVAARPLVNWITKGAVAFGEWADKTAAAKQKSGEMAAFFEKTRQTFHQVWTVVKELGGALYNIGRQSAPLGRTILKSLGESATSFREWTDSAKGKNVIAAYFKEIKPAIWEMGRLLHDITIDFFKLGKNTRLSEIIGRIRKDMLPVIVHFLKTTTSQFGPVLVETLTELLKLADVFAGTSGPLNIMLKVITALSKVIEAIVNSNPVIKSVFVSLFAATAIMKGIKFAAIIHEIPELIKLFKGLKMAALGAATAEEAAAAGGVAGKLGGAGGIRGIAKKGAGLLGIGATAATTVAPAGMLSGADMSAVGLAPEVGAAAAAVPPAAPWIALGAAVVAVGVGIVELYKHSKAFREIVKPVTDAAVHGFDEIKESFGPLGDAVSELAHSFGGNGELVKNLKFLWGYAKPVLSVMAQFWKTIFVGQIKGAIATLALAIRGIAQVLSGQVQVIRGVVEVITGIFTLHFGKVWSGLKNIFSGGIKTVVGMLKIGFSPVAGIIANIGHVLSTAFGGVWDKVAGVFETGINAVIDLVNDMIGLVNKLPFIELGEVGHVGGGGAAKSTSKGGLGKTRGAQSYGKGAESKASGGVVGAGLMARGGKVDRGKPTGDSVPTILERNEYVLNKKAVAAAGGPRELDKLNFGSAPRFAGRGRGQGRGMDIGGFASDALDSTVGAAGRAAAGAARSVAGTGAEAVLNSLPTPTHGFFGTMAKYLKSEMVGWVSGKAADWKEKQGSGGSIADAGNLQAFNKAYPEHTLSGTDGRARFSEALTAHIASWAGLPGRTFGQVAHGESNFYPGVFGIDPGGTEGLGLWQITTGFNDARIRKWGGREQMFNPLKNAKAAKEIYDEQGLGAWYGTGFVTGDTGGAAEYLAAGGPAGFKGALPRGYILPDMAAPKSEFERLHDLGVRGFQGGGAVAMASGGSLIDVVLNRAKELNGIPYPHPDSHFGLQENPSYLDCSAAVSNVLWKAGLLDEEMVSGALEGWGHSGPGSKMTVYANSGHAWMEILGHPWGTSVGDSGSGGLGFHPQPDSSYKGEFVKRHSPAVDSSTRGGAGAAAGAGPAAGGGPKKKPIPAEVKGKYEKKEPAFAPGGFKEVEKHYKVQTAPLSFPAVPNNLNGITKELRVRQRELLEYTAAARGTKRKDTKEALLKNVQLLRERIGALRDARAKIIQQRKQKKRLSRISAEAEFAAFTDPGGLFDQAEEQYERAQETADHVVQLEPTAPENAPADWLKTTLEPYVTGMDPLQETGALNSVLSSEAAWRNTVLSAEETAAGKIGGWGHGVEAATGRIKRAKERAKEIKDRVQEILGYKDDKPKAWEKYSGDLPGLRQELQQIPGKIDFFGAERDAFRANIDHTTGEVLPEWEDQLATVQGPGRSKEKMSSLPGSPDVSGFGGYIWDTQSTLSELGLKLKQSTEGSAPEETALEAINKVLGEEEVKRARVTNLLNPVFTDFFSHVPKYGGVFHSGGVVPGRRGEERTIVAEAGEIVAQPGTTVPAGGDRPHPVVIVEDGAVNADRIRHIWSDEMEKRVSLSRRRIGG